MTKQQRPTDPQRRALMQRVRRSGTSTELTVARLVRQMGLHYRLNVRSLPGSPDLANQSKGWAIFVNGCFWHHHKGCHLATTPRRNYEFWTTKFVANRTRDAIKIRRLRDLGFRVFVIWQCELEDLERLGRRLQRLAKRVS